MKESDIRKRLAEITKQLDEEKAKNERAQQTIADLAKAAARGGTCIPCQCPAPAPLPVVNPPRMPPGVYAYMTPFWDPPGLLPPFFVAYAVAFPGETGPLRTLIWTSTTIPPGTGKGHK